MSVGIDKLASELQKVIEEKDKNKKTPYDTEAEVVRVDTEVVWVKIPGGVDETPVQKTVNAKVGDIVQVRVSGGRAFLVGNGTNPPTDDTVAHEASYQAQNAQVHAVNAEAAAADAQKSAESARIDASVAHQMAENATESAEEAGRQAGLARQEASNAHTAANDALRELGTVQDVVGVVEWAAQHSEQDMADFINSHLALTQYGLNILLDNTSYRVHIGTLTADGADGVYIIDSDGHVVTTLSESIRFDSSRPQYIGGDDAYIVFNPTDGSIRIGGSKVVLGTNKTLTQILSDIVNAANTANEYITDISDTGIKVHPSTNGDRNYTQITPDGFGVYINGELISMFGESIRFNSEKAQYIGDDNAFIVFNPDPGTITLGGDILFSGGKSLSEVLSELESKVAFDVTYTYSGDSVLFDAHMWSGTDDVRSKYDENDFSWSLRTEDGEEYLDTGYSTSVLLSSVGYSATIICRYGHAESFEDDEGNAITTSNNDILAAKSPNGYRTKEVTLYEKNAFINTIRQENEFIKGEGGYVYLKPNADTGYPEEILIMDHPRVEDAVQLIRMNKNGIAFSKNGYNGSYITGWSIDGVFNADIIQTGIIKSKNGLVYFDLDNNELACSRLTSPLSVSTSDTGSNRVYLEMPRSYGLRGYAYMKLYDVDNASKGMQFIPYGSGTWKGTAWDEYNIIEMLAPTWKIGNGSEITGWYVAKSGAAFGSRSPESGYLFLLPTGLGSGGGSPNACILMFDDHYWNDDGTQIDTGETQISGKDTVVLYANTNGTTSTISLRGRNIDIQGLTSVKANQLKVTGVKSREVKTATYGNRLLYSYETPTPLFGDIGETIINEDGFSYIDFDDIFSETITVDTEYQVFLQKEGAGDCWVANKSKRYFVIEGTPGLKVAWEIKAKQKDYESIRLEDSNVNYEDYTFDNPFTEKPEEYSNYINEQEDIIHEDD